MAVKSDSVAQHLKELIDALDRRVPHVERAGEDVIARQAAALRALAVDRLAELTRNDASTPGDGDDDV
jgi:hypothetical protein